LEILVQFESNLVEGAFGLGFRSILTDITEQTKSEKVRQRTEPDKFADQLFL
jgi:hypothetical protein